MSKYARLKWAVSSYFEEMYETYANRRSWIGPIFHCLLCGPGWLTVYYAGYTRFIPCEYLSETHLTIIPIVGLFGWFTFINALISNPGRITKDNVKEIMTKYEYDDIIYIRDKICKTCNIPKPARSKHCTLCNECVEHFDHHCYWINKCVTRHNYLRFFLLAVTHMFIFIYALYVFIAIQHSEVYKQFDKGYKSQYLFLDLLNVTL